MVQVARKEPSGCKPRTLVFESFLDLLIVISPGQKEVKKFAISMSIERQKLYDWLLKLCTFRMEEVRIWKAKTSEQSERHLGGDH